MASPAASRNREPVGPGFFRRSTLEVAPELIGMVLNVVGPGGTAVSGRIVEVEAYLGPEDPASHAAQGPTPRAAIMFGPPAVAYVYLIYGMHHCLNFVTEAEGRAGAVLIRALQPLAGREVMAARRGLDPTHCTDRQLTGGPGKLCQACGIDLRWNGLALTPEPPEAAAAGRLWLGRGTGNWDLRATTRVGIRKAADRPYRFLAGGNPCLSRE